MMFKKILFIILAALLLQGCATARMAEELEQGKRDFTAGNFHQAFRWLLPPAIDGDAEAQYAVGYMYYYGYGVARDTEAGIFWMTKSAQKNYGPAKKAMCLLSKK